MLVLTDNRIAKDCLATLKDKGYEPILLPSAPQLQEGVSSHVDMLVFIGFGRLFCHASYYEQNAELISRICEMAKLTLTISTEIWNDKYPHDVIFNACLVGSLLICNKKSVSRLILEVAEDYGYKIINVPQGYTKCSVCVVSDNAIITADKAIAKACHTAGVDVLTVREGYVCLPPYDFGFIGGTSGACGNNVYFCGSLDTHPDADDIRTFCAKHGKTAVSLSMGKLFDVGSLFFI